MAIIISNQPSAAFIADTDVKNYAPTRLPKELIKQLSQRSFWRAFGIVLLQWTLIGLTIALSEWAGSVWVTVLCIVFIATRQHALLIMMHDACHFLVAEKKVLNDVFACIFCSFPFLISLKRYRNNHLAHHRLLNQETDPDLADNGHPKTKAELYRQIAGDLLFLSVPKNVRRSKKFGVLGLINERGPEWWTERVLAVSLLFALIGALTFTGTWGKFALYWLVPLFSVLQALLRYRGYSEHAGRFAETDVLKKSRTIDVGPVDRVLFAPCNVNRHLEHHLYPSVPCYNLEALHGVIAATPEYSHAVKSVNGYLGPTAGKSSVFSDLYR